MTRSIFGALGARLVVGALLLGSLPFGAQAYTYSVLIDSDNNPATGCSVSVPGATALGVDARLDAQLTFEPPSVQTQQLRLCSGGSFGAPQTLPGAGYPVGIDRAPGPFDVIELAVERDLLGTGLANDWGLTFLASSPLLGAVDVAGPLLAAGIGQPPVPPPVPRPAVIPAAGTAALILLCLGLGLAAAWSLRRHPGLMLGVLMIGAVSSAGIAWAAGYLLDGEIGDWDVPALITDPAGDPTQAEPQVDIRAVFAAREGGRVFFRFDVSESRLPVLVPPFLNNSFNVDENTANNVLVGSLRNSNAGLAGLLRFALTGQTPSAGFSVDPNTGEVRVADSSQLDFEARPLFTLNVDVTLQGATGFSLARTVTINLNDLNEAPQIAPQSFTVLETAPNGSVVGTMVASDVDAGVNGQISYSVIGGTGQTVFAVAASGGQITVANSAALNAAASPYTLQIQVADGGTPSLTATATATINVTDVNDAPSFTAGPNVTVNEDSGAYSAGWATNINDNDGGTQTLSFQFTANSNAALFSVAPAISPTGVLSFTPAANAHGVANVTVVLQDNGGTANGGSDTSAPASFSITVNSVNDAPSFSIPANAPSVLAGAGPQSVPGFATSISPGPADEAGQILNFQVTVTGTTGNLAFTSAPAIDASSGTLTYAATGSTTGTATVSVVLRDDGGTANGGIDASAPQVFTVNVLFVNVAPSFTGGGNVSVAEDSGAYNAAWATAIDDGDPSVVQGLTFIVQANDNPGLFAAAPAVNAGTGNLSFTPAANASGVANLTVVLQDDGGTDNGGADTSAPVSFSITVNAVNDPPLVVPPTNVAVTRHIGRSLGAASAEGLLANVSDPADGPGAAPFSVTVQTNAPTLGGGRVTIAADGSWSYAPPASNTAASDSFDFEVCDSGVPLPPACVTATATLSLSGTAVWFVDAAAAAGGDGTLARPFNALAPALTAAGSNGRIFLASGSYGAGGSLQAGQWLIGQGVSVASAISFDALFGLSPPAGSATRPSIGGARPLITSSADAITLSTGNSLRGIEIGNTTGNGLVGSGFGTLTLGDNRISGSGQALNLDNGILAQAPASTAFDQISSSSGVNNIQLSAIGGAADFGAGAVSGASGTAFEFSAGTATLIYAGNISKTSPGRLLDITGAGAANLALSGDLSCTATCTSGIRVNTRNAGSYVFSGTSKTIAPASGNVGIDLGNNAGATLRFENGGLAVTTTNATAFNATGGGTVSVLGAGNTLAATTGTALNVVGTSIGSDDLTFRSITSSGGASGIVLNTTGSAGGLNVSGNGGACSSVATCTGGAIQNSTGAGIQLSSVSDISLTRMIVQNSAQDGILIDTIDGFTLDNSVVTGSGSTGAHDGIDFSGNAPSVGRPVNGAIVISNSTISNAAHDLIDAQISAGTSSWDINNVTLTGIPTGNQGLQFATRGSAIVSSLQLRNGSISNTFSIGAQIIGEQSSQIGLVSIDGMSFTGSALAFDVVQNDAAVLVYRVQNNSISNHSSHGANVFAATTSAAAGSLQGRLLNNTIGIDGANDSGSGNGNGLRLNSNGDAGFRSVVSNNVIDEVAVGRGIEFVGRLPASGAAQSVHATITNNTVDRPAGTSVGFCGGAPCPLASIYVQANSGRQVCTSVTGNFAYDPGVEPAGFEEAYTLQESGATSVLELEATLAPNAHLAANNTCTGTCTSPANASHSVDANAATGTVPPGTCLLPPAP